METMELKQLRAKMLLTQTEMAQVLGVALITYQRWEQGLAKPRFLHLRKIKDLCEKNGLEFEKYYK